MKTILVIEDTSTEAFIIKESLSQAGFNIIQVASSEDAKTKLKEKKPDLIVTDVVLPGESGFEFCRFLQDEPELSTIPVVICSTKDSDMDKFWGKKQGAVAYITKPIATDELVNTVKLHA
ncbi:MAG: response regulator [Acaryochloridaceae cyanobacterium RL_2_7]|nr:response regulator [Acaryochloridaceae cyanobacterium RL_2_7]